MVDCDRAKNQGCGGGLMVNAYEYVIANGGLDCENDYRYWGSFSFCNRCVRPSPASASAHALVSSHPAPQPA